MSIYRFLGKCLFHPQYLAFVKACQLSESHQVQSWHRIQKLLASGEYWPRKVNGFSSRPLEDFPISEFDDYRATLENNFDSSRSPLTGEEILFWSESSGTTGKSKIYPLTKSFQKEFQLVNGPFLYQILRNHPSFLKNKTMYFAADIPSKFTKVGIGIGFISAFNYARIPYLFKRKYACPNQVFQSKETFYKYGVLYALSQSIDTFVAIAPSTVERFFQEINKNRERLLALIHDPVVPSGFPPLNFSEKEKKRLALVLKKKRITLQDLWPDLKTIVCWKTSTCGLQLKGMASMLGSIEVVDAPYSATEGWMTVPNGTQETGGPLHCGGHVYEFIEVGQQITPDNLLKPWQLKKNHQYEIFLTTSMGFIRYRLRDILLCKGFFYQSPILEFCEKQGQAISVGQTRISDVHILRAIELAAIRFPEKWFVICAADGKKLVLAVAEGDGNLAVDLDAFDRALRQANEEYDDDRKNNLLDPISIKILPHDHHFWSQAQHAQSKPKLVLPGTIQA